MQILNTVFMKILEMSVTAGFVIAVVLLVRFLMRGLPKSFAYALWVPVAFRLIIPTSVSADISIFNIPEIATADKGKVAESEMTDSETAKQLQSVPAPLPNQSSAGENSITGTPAESSTDKVFTNHNKPKSGKVTDVFALIWITGIMTLASYSAITYIRFRKKILYSIRFMDNIYECDHIRSPFVLGIFFPKIYIPFRLSENERKCILLHEQCHIRRKDYLIKGAAWLLVLTYWFHPLVWIAYCFMCRDMEMSCDEKVIAELGGNMKQEYSMSLLAFATNKRRPFISLLAFGEESTMKRVRNILDYRRPARWKTVVGVTVIAVTMAACATDAGKEDDTVENSEAVEKNTVSMKDKEDETVERNTISVKDTVDGTAKDGTAKNNAADIAHQPAQWAENSMFDLEFPTLDYADKNKIVFHISSGLFEYSLNKYIITGSLDLKALNCQEIQTGGKCRIEVYAGRKSRLKAVINPYPYRDEDRYLYDFETDELILYDAAALEGYTLFTGRVSKYDLTDADFLNTWKVSEYVVPLEDGVYGVLYYDDARLDAVKYVSKKGRWKLFKESQATMPKLLKQDDSFYESYALHSGKNISQCRLDYENFYNAHDYAGVCALSTGLEYSDGLQEEWLTHTDGLTGGKELSHTEDEKEYTFQFIHYQDIRAEDGERVSVTFTYIEGQGWRADGLPELISEETGFTPLT